MNNKMELDEKYRFFRRKWIRSHTPILVIYIVIILGLFICGCVLNRFEIIPINTIFAFCVYLIFRNKMISYIEKNIY